MWWDNVNEELLQKLRKRIDLKVFKSKTGYSYRLNGNITRKGFKTHKEAIIHANKLNDEIIHG